MRVIVADNSGFCFGVKNAIDSTLNIFESDNKNIYSLGPLIHNNQVIEKLGEMGLKVIDDIDNIDKGKVIIRSHGVPLDIYELAQNKEIEIVDCTCPFVRKIQKKVSECYEKEYTIVIIGDAKHPEVIGINGWCNNEAYIVNTKEDIEVIPDCDKICIVAQTTITNDKFKELSQLIVQEHKNVEIFNTICNATQLRQESCKEVAKKVDAMIVIGGYHSSNTQKLVEISKAYCKDTYHIETVDELLIDEIKKYETIGITAGASTPKWIIKEVFEKMNSIDNMDEMMKAIEDSMVRLHRGEVVKGKVISLNDDEIMVNIGYKSDGIIKRDELSNDPSIKPSELISIGDEIEVYIVSLDDGDGNVVLSKKRVDNIKGWEEVEDLYKNKKDVKVKVTEVVKGGAIALINGLRGFIPASQIADRYVEDLKTFVGKMIDVRIIEFDKEKKRIILSRKQVEKEELEAKRAALWNTLENNKEVEGEVKRLTDFGAFVDLGGIDGLIHISDLSWSHVKHPSEVVKVGDTVKVVVLNIDRNKSKVSLGLKQRMPHPWENILSKYNQGDIVEGTVTKLVDFGAFVRIESGIEGLVHISQICDEHIAKVSEKISVGQKVKVKILDIKEEDQRMSLSIKEANEKINEELEQYNTNEEITIGEIINKTE